MIELTHEEIDVMRVLAEVRSPRAGAVVLFLGTTRQFTEDRETRSLFYECYEAMARGKLAELEGEAKRRWRLEQVCLVHRTGHLQVGETSVAIAVSAPHRREAFEAGQWLIDTIKEVVPIGNRSSGAAVRANGYTRVLRRPADGNRMTMAGLQAATTASEARVLRETMVVRGPLVDQFGRLHANLRVSVTDRCNMRCFYCMPNENVVFKPRREILSFEEIERFVRIVEQLGVHRIRITGGEPLVRADLHELVKLLHRLSGISDLAMTTNGILLADQAETLRRAGLQRLNISLDGLTEKTFGQITRRRGLQQVLDGIAEAQRVGFAKIRLNAVAIRGLTESEIVPLAEFARQRGLELRFIEFMPLDGDKAWESTRVLSGATIRAIVQREVGPLVAAARPDPSQPAVDYRYADGKGRIGFISPITEPFCGTCNRLRITAEGQVRNCLFSAVEWDARALLRSGGSDEEIAALVKACVAAKKAGHGLDSPEFVRPSRAMYEMGG